eukprot:577120_1
MSYNQQSMQYSQQSMPHRSVRPRRSRVRQMNSERSPFVYPEGEGSGLGWRAEENQLEESSTNRFDFLPPVVRPLNIPIVSGTRLSRPAATSPFQTAAVSC